MENKTILTLDSVSYQYVGTNRTVLHKVSVEFKKGNVYVIMGKSGAGKSTLLSLLSGIDVASDGVIHYHGQDLRTIDRDRYRAKHIGVIFQGYNLLNNATALDNIVLSMEISGVKQQDKKQFALDLLAQVGIDKETAHRKILKLSGGEQQRIGIARALAHHPDIVIADEPTGNLDGESEEHIIDILKTLAHVEQKCVIIVSHSKKVANYADELWGLNQGNLVFVK